MKQTKNILQLKILSGYLILFAVIGCILFVLWHERIRIHEIETESQEISHIHYTINTAHRYITNLATRGESVIVWKEEDYRKYRESRLRVDSLLVVLQKSCNDFVRPQQIDTLRRLLSDKEERLLHIMQMLRLQQEADSLLVERLPGVVRQATRIREVTRKKKGIGGWLLGEKETLQVMPSAEELYSLNKRLIALQEESMTGISAHADSLRIENEELNSKLNNLITLLDGQAYTAFRSREQEMADARSLSYRSLTSVLLVALLLLFVSYLIILRDIRKRERGRLKLQKIIDENNGLLEMRKNIILTVSHDIRGPLGNINNCAELAMETREKRKRNAYLGNILVSCRHILHLANNLMDVYRINEAKDTRNEIPFRLDQLLERIAENYSLKANDNGLLFQSVHENAGVTVKGDTDKIERILENLLTNAVKFTPSGSIRFTSVYCEGALRVEVTDTGIGMDRETIGRIFRPFERAAQEVNSEGFGLGLPITEGLVKLLDGTIGVESEPGKGSVFSVVLPLAETSEETEPEEVSNGVPAILPKRILVIDDDPILLKVTEDMLARNGVACVTCPDVKEAVARLRKSNYDLVLTDIQMPLTDGFGVLKLLRSSDIGNSRTVPVAVMTARGDGDSGVYTKAGFCGSIHKPFSMKGLLAFISSVMAVKDTAPEALFDFSALLENSGDGCDMYRLVIAESIKNKTELEEAMKNGDRKSLRETVHRMMPVWELLGTKSVLQAYRDILHDKNADDRTVMEQTLQVIAWVERLINESEKGLENNADEKEDTDS